MMVGLTKSLGLLQTLHLHQKGSTFSTTVTPLSRTPMGKHHFLFPYSNVKELLSSTYFTQDFFNEANSLAHTYTKHFDDELSIFVTPAKSDRLRIVLDVKNNSYNKRYENHLSITFVGEK